ncbi:serine/threonine protein kinase (plasmid) [Embleya sp. NBC_00888]|uniref:WD40 repeat domain-containing serine/threonine protein kinase n=1 Tax=Embleya sp. NBC_00888 TaxID=2975960 RepID=UPI002F90FFFD|nr:serine/threonine protein kinase [Embleya sp. NBC_00888]
MTGTVGLLVGGRYRLVEAVGQGGMGRVWRGHDDVLNREVAVKEVLLPADLPDAMRDRLIARTKREAQAAARLQHPGIVTVFDVSEHDGVPWIVMEFVRGSSLGAHLAEHGRLSWERAAAVGADLAEALAHAHAAGVVHRDLKPDNVLLAGDRVVVTDFGIARVLDDVSRLTSTHTVIGTPHYMAPEQLEGARVEGPADLWALGATLYTAVEGRPPFDGPTLTAIITAVLTAPLPPAAHAGPLGRVVEALLSREPRQRPDAPETARRLRALNTSIPGSGVHFATTRRARVTVREGTPSGDEPVGSRRPSRRAVLIGGSAALAAAAGVLTAVRLTGGDVDDNAWFRLAGHTGPVNCVAFGPDGKSLAGAGGDVRIQGGGDTTVRLWDLARRTTTATLTGHTNVVNAVAFSPDGRTLADGAFDGTVRLWDVTARSAPVVLTSRTREVRSVAFSPDGKTLAVGGGGASEGIVQLWDVAARSATKTFDHHTAGVCSVAFSPDGKTLAGGSADDTVRLWDLATGTSSARLAGHTETVNEVAFSPDGKTVASGSFDGTVRLWDIAAQSTTATLTGHGEAVYSVAFSPDGKTLATGGSDHIVRLWNVADRTRIAALTGHTKAVYTVAFSPDGTILAGGGADHGVRVWKIP